jgi:hypothetical protein
MEIQDGDYSTEADYLSSDSKFSLKHWSHTCGSKAKQESNFENPEPLACGRIPYNTYAEKT